MSTASKTGISSIELLGQQEQALPAYMQHERKQALQNLLTAASFHPHNDNDGPYGVKLSIEDGRLVIRMTSAAGQDLNMLVLALKPYKRLIQDYFLMLDSYEQARQTATPDKLEAIDMGRRSVHNEGAELLMARLKDKIEMDFETARKFFTLICVLHKTNMRLAG